MTKREKQSFNEMVKTLTKNQQKRGVSSKLWSDGPEKYIMVIPMFVLIQEFNKFVKKINKSDKKHDK
jgi:hypothetical protein